MKVTFILMMTFWSSFLVAQSPYWVMFTDKPTLYKMSPEQLFSETVKQKRLEKNIAVDITDYPVHDSYIRSVIATGAELRATSKWFNSISVMATEIEVSRILSLPFVKSVDPVGKFIIQKPTESTISTENFPIQKVSTLLNYGNSLNQNQTTNLTKLHDLWIRGLGIVVGIQDAGIRWKGHPAFENVSVLAEYDFIDKDTDPTGDDSHGTAVFSMMGAMLPGTLIGGTYGSAFVLSKTEYVPKELAIEEDYWVEGVEWQESQGVDVMNSSLGYLVFDNSPGLPGYRYSNGDMNGTTAKATIAADIAVSKGMAVFVAMGNEGNLSQGTLSIPADGFNVFSSGAVNASGSMGSFSSTGPTNDGRVKPDGNAMGVSNYYARFTGSPLYGFGNGTSYSSPMNASAGALILSVYPDLTPLELNDALRKTASDYDNPTFNKGYGLVDAEKALFSIGPGVSNHWLTSIFNDSIVVLGKIGWTNPILQPDVHMILYISPTDSVVLPCIDITNGEYKFSGHFPVLSPWTQIKLAIRGKDNQNNKFSWPRNNSHHRYFFTNDLITRSDFIRRGGQWNDLPVNTKLPPQKVVSIFPNPFNLGVNIYSLPYLFTNYKVRIYNSIGQLLHVVDGVKELNYPNIVLSINELPPIPSGLILFVIEAEGKTVTGKAIYLK